MPTSRHTLAPERAAVVQALREHGIERGILVQMARDGQLLELRCEMPDCYNPAGRDSFVHTSLPMLDWAPNIDHHPVLKVDHGEKTPDNVRVAHVLCNREDYSWRKRVKDMLVDRESLAEIADRLNKKGVRVPRNQSTWTDALVREVYFRS